MSMKLRAGKRLEAIRRLSGLERKDFCELVGGINYSRLVTVENLRGRVSEDELEPIGIACPEVIPFIAYEGIISKQALSNSPSKLSKLLLANIECGRIPSGYHLDNFIK